MTWTVDHHTTVQLLGAYFEAVDFLRETTPRGRNTAYISGEKGSDSWSEVMRV